MSEIVQQTRRPMKGTGLISAKAHGASRLEWTFRLAQEPRRLMRRYAVTNSLFCWYAMREWVGREE